MNLGRFGEEKALKYLIASGYGILYRNFRCKAGEVDIIAEDPAKDNVIVFFEVKTRKNRIFGLPCQSVTASKLHKIEKVIKTYAYRDRRGEKDYRIDIIEILIIDEKIYLRHLENVSY